ncbi:MAG: GNAT family N-acetyltransferase [Glutamicibacter sp.]
MNLRIDTVLKVQAAWAQVMDVPPESLANCGTRIYRENNSSPILMFVSLFGVGTVVGPKWALDMAHDLTDQELASHAKLLEISAAHGGQPLGEAELYFCDTVPSVVSLDTTMSGDPRHAVALERACSPEDSAEVGLSQMNKTYVLLGGDEPSPQPLTGCGYDIWVDRLAHMGVLTAPGRRRQGHGSAAVSRVVAEAMESGLVPQWRARTDNASSIRTALNTGFKHAGSQTTVRLGA